MSVWTHIILEAYCTRNSGPEKGKYLYELVDAKNFKTRKKPNPFYDPAFKNPRKPKYCPGVPQYLCLEKDCLHFGYTNAEEKDYLFLNKRYNKKK